MLVILIWHVVVEDTFLFVAVCCHCLCSCRLIVTLIENECVLLYLSQTWAAKSLFYFACSTRRLRFMERVVRTSFVSVLTLTASFQINWISAVGPMRDTLSWSCRTKPQRGRSSYVAVSELFWTWHYDCGSHTVAMHIIHAPMTFAALLYAFSPFSLTLKIEL